MMVWAFLLSVACELGEAPAEERTVRDSAGVRIVESHSPRERWELAPLPAIEVGVAEGDPSLLFDGITAAIRLPDGSIVVANCAEPVLRWFGDDGTLRHAAGRIGQGPGEFRPGECSRPGLWQLPGDSIGSWQHAARRMKVFDPAGRHVRDVSLHREPVVGNPYVVGRFADGGFAVFVYDPVGSRRVGEIWRDSLTFHHYRADGSYGGRIGRLPGPTWVWWEFQMGIRAIGNRSFRPLAPHGVSASHGEYLYYGSGDRFDVGLYDRTGALRTIIRRALRPRSVTRDLIATYRRNRAVRSVTRDDSITVSRMERILGAREFPETVSAIREIRVDREGLLWVREYALPEAETASWSVFDRDGGLLAEMEVAVPLQVLDLGRDHVIVVARDSLDVEQVRVYNVSHRPARDRPPRVTPGRR
jgi:hypothetical protein